MKEEKELHLMTLNEVIKMHKEKPKAKYLWNGIKEKTFGFIFGPSKGGKTIVCENLAMNLAIGKNDFLGYELDGIPKKVLFVGLEEFWEQRAERNEKQFMSFSDEEQIILGENYVYQGLDFSRKVTSKKEWEDLSDLIKVSKAEVVFIDSITRMNHGNLEESKTAEEIVQKLRDICYDSKITLICIHHTPKLGETQELSLNCIKGSSTFSQEIDFAIGINRTVKNHRYMKNVAFRYAPDDDEFVKEFEIDEDLIVEVLDEVEETEILNRVDRRRKNERRGYIVSFLNENASMTYSTAELLSHFSSTLSIRERMIKKYLTELSIERKILSPEFGKYTSIENGK
ncbi:MAG: AAA family ATPase [Ignavibacteriae bacterium]|nr:AAA family ATPase [Ignavibacteriota bacterium]